MSLGVRTTCRSLFSLSDRTYQVIHINRVLHVVYVIDKASGGAHIFTASQLGTIVRGIESFVGEYEGL